MKLTYNGIEYDCISVERKSREIVIHTGLYQDGEEIVHNIYGDIDFSAVALEGGTWSEPEESTTLERRVETLETSNADLTEAVDMILSGVTE